MCSPEGSGGKLRFRLPSELGENLELGDVHRNLGCSRSLQRACAPSATSVWKGAGFVVWSARLGACVSSPAKAVHCMALRGITSKSAVEQRPGSISPWAGRRLLWEAVFWLVVCCATTGAVPGRSESSRSAARLDESLPYSLKANCGTRRSAEYSCAGIWEQGRDGRSAPLALCHVKISPYIIWLPRVSLHLLCTPRELRCQGMRLL